MTDLVYEGLRLRGDFTEAVRPDGTRVAFTRTERKVLADLVAVGPVRTVGLPPDDGSVRAFADAVPGLLRPRRRSAG